MNRQSHLETALGEERGFVHKRIFGGIKGIVGGFISGGPTGAFRGGVSGLFGRRNSRLARLPSRGQTTRKTARFGLLPPSVFLEERFAPPRALAGSVAPGPGGECPKGERLNKSSYHLMDGTFVPAKSRCVSIRRMQVTNTKALRKGMRRVEGFAKVAKRTISFTKRVRLKKRSR